MTVHPVHASSAPSAAIGAALPPATGVLAVCAHPDDESFGLGAVLAALTDAGVPVAVLCFTHGEASTLHATPGELAAVRVDELSQAAAHLGVGRAELLAYPDGRLADQPLGELAQHVRRLADDVGADTLVAPSGWLLLVGRPSRRWSPGLAGQEGVAVHLEGPGLGLARRAAEGVGGRSDLDGGEAGLFEHLLPTRTGQPTGDSAGPEVDVPQGLRGDGAAVGDVGELQHATGTEHPEDLAEHGPLVRAEVDHTVGDHDVS